ncbi:hypothetical protein [Algoriphagus aquimarinus]|uniref:Uncharacterized protein n=1 Tax=Algoriphagus aquimarinus TaxID=237018 RepID=A0A1I1CEH0_9BACT|nr:hypothetical protein [Algoriphagus aquimarinus]SFB60396.1 hypothetical protein SAMN04489723_12914 [Algoriphagus aquimarinus]
MTVSKGVILDRLMETLETVGVSPIPERRILLERISARMHEVQSLKMDEGKSKTPEASDFTSPVCFANSAEVQTDYMSEYEVLKQIDGYIDRLIRQS